MTQIPSVPPMAGGWRMEGTDFPSSYPAVPRPPYSLFRHVLQLQVVHLQSSPQMQIPPRREDRATHVRTELEWETQVRCTPSQSQSLWAVPRQWLDKRVTMLPSITPSGEDHPVVPCPVHTRKLGWLPQHPPGSSLKHRFLGRTFEIF